MIFTINPIDYASTGLNDCCSYKPIVNTAYCGRNLSGSECTTAGGTIVSDANGNSATGIYACNVGAPTGTSCSAFSGSRYIATSTVNQYISSGLCIITTSDGACPGGCSNGLTIKQSVDLCDLAASSYAQLGSQTLNMFNKSCSS